MPIVRALLVKHQLDPDTGNIHGLRAQRARHS
jgi:hypothetical protein